MNFYTESSVVEGLNFRTNNLTRDAVNRQRLNKSGQ